MELGYYYFNKPAKKTVTDRVRALYYGNFVSRFGFECAFFIAGCAIITLTIAVMV